MRILVLVVLCSLLFVVPCIADVSGGCPPSVVTNVLIDNQTPVNYGWVGIQKINTTTVGPDSVRSVYKEILKYDARGRVIEYKETISENGEIIQVTQVRDIVYTSLIELFPQPSWVKKLGPNGFYSTHVFTAWAGYDADYRVDVKVTKLQYFPPRIWGDRGRRIIIPAYYKPLPDKEVATVFNSFYLILESFGIIVPLP